MIHYIYKIIFLCGTPENRYYIGKRSTGEWDNWDEDPYAGSGVFCDNYFKEYGKIKNKTYQKQCLEENSSYEENRVREDYWIEDAYKLDPLCMNRVSGGGGASHLSDIFGKQVYQYDLNGKLIETFISASEASRSNRKYNVSTISRCCLNKTPQAYGYIWKYENKPPTITEIKNAEYTMYAVDQYTEDGTFVKSWPSVIEAAKTLNISKTTIYNIIAGSNKNRYTVGGFAWVRKGEQYIPKKKKPFIGRRKVKQYTKSLKFVASFNSFKEAAQAVSGKWQCIQSACEHVGGTAYDYIWITSDKNLPTKPVTRVNKRVVAKCNDSGEIISIYNTLKEAGDSVNGHWQCVQKCCNGKQKYYKTYTWKFLN